MTDHELQQRFSKTIFVVEATSAEQFFLWQERSDTSDCMSKTYDRLKVRWEELSEGCWTQIGKIGKRPVCISLSWARIEGQLVLFWRMTSEVTDLSLAEKYLNKMMDPFPMWDNGRRRAETDAMNFHLAVEAARQINGRF